jgi:O-antigen/teichoic acid export membrane protein
MSTQAVALPAAGRAARAPFAGAWILSGATILSGLLTYGFHVLAARTLGPAAYGQIAVLWAALFLAAVVLCRPLEQTTSRALADRLARGEEATAVLRAVALLASTVVVAIGLAAALGWETVRERLFAGDDLLTALLVGGIAVYALAYAVRGLVAGIGWFGGYGLALVADTGTRLALALPLVAIASPRLAAVAVAGAGAAGIVAPLATGRRRLRVARDGLPGQRFRLGSALGFAAPASIVAAADQLFVNGGPILVMLGGGEDASAVAGVVFAATMLVRVPVYLFQGLAASLLPNLTRLHAVEDTLGFRRAVVRTAAVLLMLGAATVVGAAAVGPETLRILYGSGFEAGRLELTLLGAGVGVYLVAATLSQALLALGRAGVAACAWTASGLLFVGLYAIGPGEELMRIGFAFLAAALFGLLALALLVAARIGAR